MGTCYVPVVNSIQSMQRCPRRDQVHRINTQRSRTLYQMEINNDNIILNKIVDKNDMYTDLLLTIK